MRLLASCIAFSAVVFQSTHPARGATTGQRYYDAGHDIFQSTHPARGATSGLLSTPPTLRFQSTHPARGATPANCRKTHPCCISIHAPRKGCDFTLLSPQKITFGFQSTHPARGATSVESRTKTRRMYFNPRTPQGVRRLAIYFLSPLFPFQSTHPARGATEIQFNQFNADIISIHAPRKGCDYKWYGATPEEALFQSTHPARGATPQGAYQLAAPGHFNPRTPQGVRQRL